MVDGWLSTMDLLSEVFVAGSGSDRRFWEIDIHGIFSVKYFCKKPWSVGEVRSIHPKIWKCVLPFKVNVF